MLFREGELGSPSSRRLAKRGADGEAWGLETLREGRADQSNLTPAFPPRDLAVRNILDWSKIAREENKKKKKMTNLGT